ncbi:MAG TPA: UvrD-helicase domain-containing protein [Rectinemataceae bacterium]|nr:UvrD-helicase domain-containing protein [Rectinemataceae bacterium]
MRLVADLHIHSHYSLATSPKLTPAHLDRWARIKGISLVGTGDCTHPAWLAELGERLEPAGEGFFRLKPGVRRAFDAGEALAEGLPEPRPGEGSAQKRERVSREEPFFVLSGEISTIYSAGGRTRKVHHLVLLPDFAAAAAFQAKLERVGSITSDGRPILGIDSRDLFELLLEADDRSVLMPAHIWTPWFSALGARSGFDSIDDCYRDLAPRIRAVETGLSSNPPMNWAVSALDRFSIISNSDAHSPEKLGREATILDIEPGFPGLAEALSGGGPAGRLLGTVEFFPQEGKYHYDGHRACGVALSPEESAAAGGLCPVCGKPLTPGVMGRVAELADRPVDDSAPCPESWEGTNRRPYRSLIPLKELVAELLGVGEVSKKVAAAYNSLVERSGSEFDILLDRSEKELEALGGGAVSGELLAAAVGRMREARVSIVPGYDGEYGRVRAFAPGEKLELGRAGEELFADSAGNLAAGNLAVGNLAPESDPKPRLPADEWPADGRPADGRPAGEKPAGGGGRRKGGMSAEDKRGVEAREADPRRPAAFDLDPAQARVVEHGDGPAIVMAGPGTGKTAVLALRIARLVKQGAAPLSIAAITFTTRAARELGERIGRYLERGQAAEVWTGTFHALCLSILREHRAEASLAPGFGILDEEERERLLKELAPASENPAKLGGYIEARKRFLLLPGETSPRLGPAAPAGLAELAAEFGCPSLDAGLDAAYGEYRKRLKLASLLDFDDLIAGAVRLLASDPLVLAGYRRRCLNLFVDEYQDLNFAQYALVRLLAPDSSSALFVIGDPNQAIYGFRGSDRRFIDRFLADYPGAAEYRLVRSFRCSPGIIGAAGRLVDAPLGGSGSAATLSRAEYPTDKSEAEGVAAAIDRLIGGTRFFAYDSGMVDSVSGTTLATTATSAAEPGQMAGDGSPALRSLGECAILLRAAALAPAVEKALFDHGIPYRLVGERPWWSEEPLRSAIALLRGAARPAAGAPIPAESPPVRTRHRGGTGGARGEPEEALRLRLPGLSPEAAVRAAVELSGSLRPSETRRRRSEADPGGDRELLTERLAERASSYKELESFLDDLALGSPQDGYEMRSERVALMTMHAAKGLEFDRVFVVGLEDGIVPFTLFEGKHGENGDEAAAGERIEEERRLLYVAMTRARVGLQLSWARSRQFRGRSLSLPPSRFLARIEELVPLLEAEPRRPRDPQFRLF